MNELNYDKPKRKFASLEEVDEMLEQLHRWLPLSREEVLASAVGKYFEKTKQDMEAKTLSTFYRGELLVEQGYKCYYCGRYLNYKKSTLDHLIPLSRGGLNDKRNTVVCCQPCNEEKDSMTFYEYKRFKK